MQTLPSVMVLLPPLTTSVTLMRVIRTAARWLLLLNGTGQYAQLTRLPPHGQYTTGCLWRRQTRTLHRVVMRRLQTSLSEPPRRAPHFLAYKCRGSFDSIGARLIAEWRRFPLGPLSSLGEKLVGMEGGRGVRSGCLRGAQPPLQLDNASS